MWIIDDPHAEEADDWNEWSMSDEFGRLTDTYWWWGSWYAEWFTWGSWAPRAGREVVEEDQTLHLYPDDLLARILVRELPTFYRFYRSLAENNSDSVAYDMPDLSSSWWDNFPFGA